MHCFRGPGHRPCCRRSVAVECSKGFGGPANRSGKPASKGTAKTVDQAAARALSAAAKNKPNVRPINPKEAARGKVEYVQIKDWAKGEAADIGELEVMPGSYNAAAYTAAGVEGAAAAASAAQPFYQQLAHHAQYLESQGALSVALEPGAKPFLPFESWQYSLGRYRQYMADLAAVHLALEQALQLALAAPLQQIKRTNEASEEDQSSSSSSSAQAVQHAVQQQPWAVHCRSAAAQQAYAALACFSPESGLWRAHAAQADVAALAEHAAVRQQQHAAKHHKQQQQQGRSGTREVHASQNAVAYGRYLLQLGRSAAAATAAAAASGCSSSSSSALRSSSPLLLEEEEGTADALRLLAHAYALHVQQQCLGTRIGAAATDHLDLMSSGVGATAVYMEYPAHVKEPLQQLVAVTNEAGRILDGAGRQAVMDELPKALRKATLMLAPLATA